LTAALSAGEAATATFGRGVAIASRGSSRREATAVEGAFPFRATVFVFAAAPLPDLATTAALPPFFPLLAAAVDASRRDFFAVAAAAAFTSARRAIAVSFVSQPTAAEGALATRTGGAGGVTADACAGGIEAAPISGALAGARTG
jgi:hypothetical protein